MNKDLVLQSHAGFLAERQIAEHRRHLDDLQQTGARHLAAIHLQQLKAIFAQEAITKLYRNAVDCAEVYHHHIEQSLAKNHLSPATAESRDQTLIELNAGFRADLVGVTRLGAMTVAREADKPVDLPKLRRGLFG